MSKSEPITAESLPRSKTLGIADRKTLGDAVRQPSFYSEIISDEDKRIKYQQAAVFNWFCSNGYVPPIQSEINDLINEVEKWKRQ